MNSRTVAILAFRVLAVLAFIEALEKLIAAAPYLAAPEFGADRALAALFALHLGPMVLFAAAGLVVWRNAIWLANRVYAGQEGTASAKGSGRIAGLAALAICVAGLLTVGFTFLPTGMACYTWIVTVPSTWFSEEQRSTFVVAAVRQSVNCALQAGAGLALVLSARRLAWAIPWVRTATRD